MITNKPIVCIGLLGPTLDLGRKNNRWEKWRPSVALCQHEDLLVDRFELLSQPKFKTLSDQVVADIETISPETDVRVHAIDFEDPWDLESAYSTFYEWVEAYDFRPDEEEYLVHITTGTHVTQICEFLLVESRHIPARIIQTSPGSKRSAASGSYTIIDLDLSKYDMIAKRFAVQTEDDISYLKAGVKTENIAFNQLMEKIEKVANVSKAPVLLTGPTGAGKTQLARRIFEVKKRRNLVKGAFVEVNCATLTGTHAMSTLFGHVKGSFTGAQKDRQGLLRAADKGVLFLDEIGDLGMDEQTMLLKALETKSFLPLGADVEVKSDFQLIAGTNADLRKQSKTGAFRSDLLARIDLWSFDLPGLKDRIEDLPPNLEYELRLFEQKEGRVVRFNREARAKYLKFATDPKALWLANFRDLNSSLTRMATLADGDRINVENVAGEMDRLNRDWHYGEESVEESSLAEFLDVEAIDQLDLFDRIQLGAVLTICKKCPSMAEAGKQLFAMSRLQKENPNDSDRIRKYLKKFGITWSQIKNRD